MLRLLSCLLLFSTLLSAVQSAAYDPRTVGGTLPLTTPSAPMVAIPMQQNAALPSQIQRGGGLVPAGYNPFGYKITALGDQYLVFGGSLDSDIGRLLASVKSRKTMTVIQTQWLEIVRVSKKAQSMRIYRTLQELIDFCLATGLID